MLGDPVTGKDFLNRERELELLKRRISLFRKGKKRNIAIIGLRKLGKTSLIFKLMSEIKEVQFVYVYLPENDTQGFLKKIVFSLFKPLYKKEEYDIKKILINLASDYPKSIKLALEILEKDNNEFFELIFELIKKIKEENKKPITIIFDEFQRIVDYDLISPVDKIREKIMWQKDICYIFSGSAVTMMNEIVASSESPLFNHFEILKIKSFDYPSARELVLSKVKGFKETSLNFLIDFTGGNPFYLDILCFRIKDLASKKRLLQIPNSILVRGITFELFYSGGALYNYFRALIEKSLGKRGHGAFIKILKAIADDKNKITEIAKESGIVVTALPRLLTRLGEMDLIYRKEKKYYFMDKLFKFWFKYVYTLRETSYVFELKIQLDKFKDQIQQMISNYKTELGKAREAQIREIFVRMKKFSEVRGGMLNNEEFDLICKNKGYWLGEVKTKNVSVKDINNFLKKSKKVDKVKK